MIDVDCCCILLFLDIVLSAYLQVYIWVGNSCQSIQESLVVASVYFYVAIIILVEVKSWDASFGKEVFLGAVHIESGSQDTQLLAVKNFV